MAATRVARCTPTGSVCLRRSTPLVGARGGARALKVGRDALRRLRPDQCPVTGGTPCLNTTLCDEYWQGSTAQAR